MRLAVCWPHRWNLCRAAGTLATVTLILPFVVTRSDAGDSWSLIPSAQHPPGRYGHALVVDPIRRRLLLFGGVGATFRNDTWAMSLDSLQWHPLVVTGAPPPRAYAGAAYDSAGDRLLVFGGENSTSLLNDVWSLSLATTPTWTHISTSGSPPSPRWSAGAADDPAGNRLVVFGGNDGTGFRNDLWALSFNGQLTGTWTQLAPGNPIPSARARFGFARDARRNRMVIFAGHEAGNYLNDTWALPLTSSGPWTSTEGSTFKPLARDFPTLVYAPSSDRFIAFSGEPIVIGPQNDTWALPSGSQYWSQLAPSGSPPAPRTSSAAAYDGLTDRMFVFGGIGTATYDDTWALQLGSVTGVEVTPVEATAETGVVVVVWATAGRVLDATAERREPQEAWRPIARLGADGSGKFSLRDASVSPGRSYEYRLAWEAPPSGYGGDIVVDVPGQFQLGRLGFTPNPAQGTPMIAFDLPGTSCARLAVFDAQGRLAWSRDFWGLQGGHHVFPWSSEVPLAGVYWIRLTVGSRVLSARGVVMH
jgi:galactose oxidase-like protein/Kelch motif protein